MKRYYLTFSFLFLAFLIKAQNLVPNYSFEIYSSCPNSGDQLNYAASWYSPTAGTPDYFNTCGTVGYQPLSNVWGSQLPRTGNAYAEIAVYGSIAGTSAREYISIQLLNPLIADKLYCVQFYVNHTGLSTFSTMYTPIAISEIGLFFSNTLISTSTWNVLPYIPQIVSPVGIIIDDTTQWIKVSGIYTALGGENYITIGNFKNDASTDTSIVGRPGYDPQGYYYVDDVSIIDCDSLVGISETKADQSFSIFPNPNNGTMTLRYTLKHNDLASFKLYDITGRVVEEVVLNPLKDQIQISSNVNKGIYMYRILVNDRILKNDKVIIIR